jgi:hypothetical protein
MTRLRLGLAGRGTMVTEREFVRRIPMEEGAVGIQELDRLARRLRHAKDSRFRGVPELSGL